MSASPEQTGGGISRRDLLVAGAGATVGAVFGERILAPDFADADDLRLWENRQRVLNNVFFSSNPNNSFYLGDVVADTVTIPAGEAVWTFPNAQSEYRGGGIDESNGLRKSIDNTNYRLSKPMVVENPVLMGGGISFTTKWMVIDGPEGAGYVQTSEDDFDAKHKEVLLGSYWSGEGHDGKLRFTASGFAYLGETAFGSDQLFFDFSPEGAPNVERLGEGLQTSEFIRISETVSC